MGKVKKTEWIMLGTFILILIFWILNDYFNDILVDILNSDPGTKFFTTTTTAFLGLSILLITRVLTWDDVLNEKGAWNTLIWFSALVMMASQLTSLGFIGWVGNQVQDIVGNIDWTIGFLILALVYFYSHYFFASNTAHVSAMYAVFLAVAIVIGTPPMFAAIVLAFFSNLMSSMTHYGTGPAPILFGAGYVKLKEWWVIGLLISVINLIIWIAIGGIWWFILGIW
jgi:DASS family divalent anion:Na+ symporter